MANDLLSMAAGTCAELLGSPDESVLSIGEITGAVMRALRLRKFQSSATGSLLTGKFVPFTVPSRSFAFTEEGFTGAVYVDRQVDAVNDVWEPVEIADVPNLAELENEGKYAIAFYGSPDWQARVSWDPALDQFNDLRIWFDPSSIEPQTLADDLGVGIKLIPLILAHDAVLECISRCRLRDKETWDATTVQVFQQTSMQARQELMEQFDVWRFESEDDTGESQAARFSESRYGGRRIRVFRA